MKRGDFIKTLGLGSILFSLPNFPSFSGTPKYPFLIDVAKKGWQCTYYTGYYILSTNSYYSFSLRGKSKFWVQRKGSGLLNELGKEELLIFFKNHKFFHLSDCVTSGLIANFTLIEKNGKIYADNEQVEPVLNKDNFEKLRLNQKSSKDYHLLSWNEVFYKHFEINHNII